MNDLHNAQNGWETVRKFAAHSAAQQLGIPSAQMQWVRRILKNQGKLETVVTNLLEQKILPHEILFLFLSISF